MIRVWAVLVHGLLLITSPGSTSAASAAAAAAIVVNHDNQAQVNQTVIESILFERSKCEEHIVQKV